MNQTKTGMNPANRITMNDSNGRHEKMSGIKELIRTEENGTISFGNYELPSKSKLSDYEHDGDMYKVKNLS